MKAEELILEVYKQKNERIKEGHHASKVIMSMKNYRLIQAYHRKLGALESDFPDYISSDSLFGLEILIDNLQETIVS